MAKKKQVKFTKKEIEALDNLRNAYAFIQSSLGSLEIQRLRAEQTLEAIENQKILLESQYVQEQANESNLLEQLTNKYGVGNLDITTGKFTPAK
jgi:chromosome segregation ATPase